MERSVLEQTWGPQNCKPQRSTKLCLFVAQISGGDDRIRTCEGLLTLNGLANRRLQPLGHISVPQSAKTNSSREPRIVKVLESHRAYAPSVSTRSNYHAAGRSFCGCGLCASHRALQLLDF